MWLLSARACQNNVSPLLISSLQKSLTYSLIQIKLQLLTIKDLLFLLFSIIEIIDAIVAKIVFRKCPRMHFNSRKTYGHFGA